MNDDFWNQTGGRTGTATRINNAIGSVAGELMPSNESELLVAATNSDYSFRNSVNKRSIKEAPLQRSDTQMKRRKDIIEDSSPIITAGTRSTKLRKYRPLIHSPSGQHKIIMTPRKMGIRKFSGRIEKKKFKFVIIGSSPRRQFGASDLIVAALNSSPAQDYGNVVDVGQDSCDEYSGEAGVGGGLNGRGANVGVVGCVSGVMESSSNYSDSINLGAVIEKLYNFSWYGYSGCYDFYFEVQINEIDYREVTLQGMHELLYIAPNIDWTEHARDISVVNRKLLDCFRSPRSTIVRVACQVSGELFRIIRSTRRPEFDDLADVLLARTADTNRFIQRDANVSLDKMVTYLPSFQVVRAICTKAPK